MTLDGEVQELEVTTVPSFDDVLAYAAEHPKYMGVAMVAEQVIHEQHGMQIYPRFDLFSGAPADLFALCDRSTAELVDKKRFRVPIHLADVTMALSYIEYCSTAATNRGLTFITARKV